MLPRSLLPLILASVFAVHTSSQYVDLLQGLQTLFQPYQFDGSVTTRKPENRRHGSRHQNNNPSNPTIIFPDDYRSDRPKTSGTTPKPSRKSSRQNSSQSPTRPKSGNIQANTRYTAPSYKENPKSNENRRNDYGLFNSDNIFFPNDDVVTTNSNRKTTQWGNKNENPVVSTQWNNKNNRNPEVSSSLTQLGSKNDNRNPAVSTTQWSNKNNNPVVSTTQWNNRNPEVISSPTQLGNKNENRNPVVSTTQWNNKNDRNPGVISSPTQMGNKNNNRNPVVSTTQWYNKNDNRNPDVTSIKKPPSLSNWDKQNVGPTRKPVTIRPGVKPAPVDESRPPITNRPVESVFPATPNPNGSDDPELEIGPDEDDMSSVEKRQYLAVADEMCETYKALNIKKVVALPLVPSPEAVEFNVSDCTPFNIPLIIGGKVSSIEEFPHMSLVGWRKVQGGGYSWKCGGSLISDQYVLTAGHCTYHEKDYNVVRSEKKEDETKPGPPHAVQLGSTYVDGPGAVVVTTSSVIRHPKYKQRRSYYDVALIKLTSKVAFTDVIKPACLGVPPPVGKPIIATGWGRTEFGGDQSLELRSVSLPIWEMQDCKEIWGTSLKLPNGPSSESHVCAGERAGGKDTCQGDSGGPAQVRDGCIWRVVAVTSSGRSCGAPDTPALYATVPRVFVAAQVFGKKPLDNRFNNQMNSNKYNQQTNTNVNNQNNFNQNNRNTNNQNNNREYYNLNTQNNRNNQNNFNQQSNTNLNNYGQQYNNNFNNQESSNSNVNNRNTNQYYQPANNYNQQNNRVTTINPNQFYNQNGFNQNQNNFNQNGYVTEGSNQNNNRGIYDFNTGNEYRVTERPWWNR